MSEYTSESLRALSRWAVGAFDDPTTAQWLAKTLNAHADVWEAERAALPGGSPAGAWELVRRMKEFHRDSLEAAERRLADLRSAVAAAVYAMDRPTAGPPEWMAARDRLAAAAAREGGEGD